MVSKYLIPVLMLMVLVISNLTIAAEDIQGHVVNAQDYTYLIHARWQWDNQLGSGPPYNLRLDIAEHWWMSDLVIDPGKKIGEMTFPGKRITGTALHAIPPHNEGPKFAPLCFAIGSHIPKRVPAPAVSDDDVKCHALVSHGEHYDIHTITIDAPDEQNGKWSVEWIGQHCVVDVSGGNELTSNSEFPTCPTEPPSPLLLELTSFQPTLTGTDNYVDWTTSGETDHAGFRLWHGVKTEYGVSITIFGGEESVNQTTDCVRGNLIVLKTEDESGIETCQTAECMEDRLRAIEINDQRVIVARGSERKETCYSYVNADNKGGIHYYLLESFDTKGNRTFHWDFLKEID